MTQKKFEVIKRPDVPDLHGVLKTRLEINKQRKEKKQNRSEGKKPPAATKKLK